MYLVRCELPSNDQTKKVYLLPKNWDQLSNLNIAFVCVLSLLIDIYSS